MAEVFGLDSLSFRYRARGLSIELRCQKRNLELANYSSDITLGCFKCISVLRSFEKPEKQGS
jgi:hypothetical protein